MKQRVARCYTHLGGGLQFLHFIIILVDQRISLLVTALVVETRTDQELFMEVHTFFTKLLQLLTKIITSVC